MHATSSGTTKTIDTGIIIRPEISSEGSFIKYQKIEGDELSWYIADTQTSNITKVETVDEKALCADVIARRCLGRGLDPVAQQ